MKERNLLKVERTILDLSHLEAGQQFEYFSDEICRRFGHQASEEIVERADFPARIDAIEVGSSFCASIKAPIHELNRTKRHVEEDDSHSLILNFMLSGVIELERGDERRSLVPSSVTIIDNGRTSSFKSFSDSGYHSSLCIRLNRKGFRDTNALSALFCEKRFKYHRLMPLLKTSLAQIQASMNGVNDLEVATLLGVVETLVSLIVQDKAIEAIDPLNDQAFHLVEAEVLRQLEDDRLGLSSVAHHLGLSGGRIEQIMLGRSTSFTSFVEEERLSLAMGRLCDEAYSKRTIEEIAQGCGFVDLPSFYNAFKTVFQCSPSEIRRAAAKPVQLN